MPNPTSITALDSAGVPQTISTIDALLAVFGALADAAAANGASGTALAYLRSIKDAATDTTTQSPVKVLAYTANSKYKAIAASASAAVIGATGATGDYLSHVLVIPATTSPGAVSITDGTGSAITIFAGGASSVASLVPFAVPVGAVSTTGAWKATTGTNVSIIGFGNLT